jgi:hypothetical protein
MADSIYSPLRQWLSECGKETVNLNFGQVEEILGRRLPRSAYDFNAWWSNEDDPAGSHTQSRNGWMAAGYIVTSVDRAFPCVTFERAH